MTAALSIVTPSLNQADFLRENLYSICTNKPSGIEHIVIDGGSTDDSCGVLRCFDEDITFWKSESDGGQYDAINTGFKHSTGEILAWLNADDVYYPWTIQTVIEIFDKFPEIEWLTTLYPSAINDKGVMIRMPETHGFDRKSFRTGFNLPGAGWPADTFIQQESTFWRRSLWDRAGGKVDSSMRYAGDFELWLRFFDNAELYAVDVPLAGFRKHPAQKTSLAFSAYVAEAAECLKANGCSAAEADVMRWQLKQSRDPETRNALVQAGLANRAPKVSYNWSASSWEIIRS